MTDIIPIVYRVKNLEILTKLLNSVAKRYGCRVEYIAKENRLKFHGDDTCCKHITEETLAFFPADKNIEDLPLSCPVNFPEAPN